MNLDPQEFLKLVEATNKLATWDIESSGGLRADYASVLCASVKPFGKKPYTFQVKQVGNDVKVVRDLKDALEEYQCWLTYYGKGFDVGFVNTRLLKWGYPPVSSRHHVDLYFTLKANTLVTRRSMAQMAGLLGTSNQKMGVSANVWNEMGFKFEEHMPLMVKRCESDTKVLEDLYRKTKHLVRDIKKGGVI